MINIFALRDLSLRAMVEAANDEEDEKKKKREEEEKKNDDTGTEEETPEDTEENGADDEEGNEETSEDEQQDEEQPEDNESEDNSEDTEGDNPDDPAPAEDTTGDDTGAGGEDDLGGDEFNMDPDGGEEEDLGPAPDGLPEADDDGSSDEENDDGSSETNVQVNILKLSELDRALAKKTCFQFFMDLRSKLPATLAIIEKNETVIDPDIRDQVVEKLNTIQGQLNQFLEYKFPIMNYEEAIQAYYVFVQDINSTIETVRNGGIIGQKPKHKNKESS